MPILPIMPIFLPVPVMTPVLPPVVDEIEPEKLFEPLTIEEEPAADPEVILVAGLNYPHDRGRIDNLFYDYCKVIAPVLHKKYGAVKITVFNFFAGTIEEFRFKDNKLLAVPVVIRNFDKPKQKNYRFVNKNETDNWESTLVTAPTPKTETTRYFPSISDIFKDSESPTRKEYTEAFKAGKLTEKSLSIGDIYSYISTLPDDALLEVHYFSHAWIGGPILANSDSFILNKAPLDPTKYLDKDGRWYDLVDKFKTIPGLADLKKKFRTDAFSEIWGCNAFVSPKIIIHTMINQPSLLKKAEGSPDEKLFIFEYNSDWAEKDRKEFHQLMKDDPANTSAKSDKKSLNEVIGILKHETDGTYMKFLAKATGKNVLGALPGTYADLDTKEQMKFGMKIMHVPMGKSFLDEQNFQGVLGFYKKNLGFAYRVESEYDTKNFGRGYAVYEP
jgi:hypothetical protein